MKKHISTQKLRLYSRIFFLVGLFLVLAGVGSYLTGYYLINYQIHQNILLANDSKAYDIWLNPPAKITRKYYLFNVSNPIEVERGTAKPKLIQMGPYCFNELLEKKNVKFLDKDLMRFDPVDTIFFEKNNCTNGSINDLVTFLNIPAMGMIESLMNGKTNGFTYAMINTLLAGLRTKLFETKTVGELISGYKDPLMEIAKIFVPKLVKDDKFSLLHGKNGTIWQNFSMNTGYTDSAKLGQIKTWDDEPLLDLYDDKYANLINGTDGTIFSPFRTRNDTVYAFSADMCRSYSLTYLKDMPVNDVTTYAYHLPKNTFYNSTINSDSPTFCGISDKCLGNGVHNISKCYGGVSGFISQPHFLNAEDKFINDLNGMKPDPNIHDFILRFEPNTGVALTGNVRLQISFYLFNNKEVNLFKNVHPVLLPMVWFDEDIELNSDVIGQLKQVNLIAQLCFLIPIILFGFGIFWLIIAIGLYCYIRVRKSDYVEIDTKSENDEKDLRSNQQSKEPDEKTALIN